jgi:PmbA protein
VTDDPHVPEGLGTRTFDGEGMTTRPRVIFENGVLRDYYLDTYYAKKLGKTPTSGARTNLIWRTGNRNIEELIGQMGTGLLVTGFNGGNSNSATGDFSFGIQGLWVDDGKIVEPVSEMNLSGNHLTFWRKLVELGSDRFMSSSNQRPSLRFEKVQFSGT